jgi:hypothetical protein
MAIRSRAKAKGEVQEKKATFPACAKSTCRKKYTFGMEKLSAVGRRLHESTRAAMKIRSEKVEKKNGLNYRFSLQQMSFPDLHASLKNICWQLGSEIMTCGVFARSYFRKARVITHSATRAIRLCKAVPESKAIALAIMDQASARSRSGQCPTASTASKIYSQHLDKENCSSPVERILVGVRSKFAPVESR